MRLHLANYRGKRSVEAVEVMTFPSGRSIWEIVGTNAHPSPNTWKFDFVLAEKSFSHRTRYAEFLLTLRDGQLLLWGAPTGIFGMNTVECGELKWALHKLGNPDLMSGYPASHQQFMDKIWSFPMVEGTFVVDDEEAEVFRLLGEPIPVLWEKEKLVRWAEERSAVDGRRSAD